MKFNLFISLFAIVILSSMAFAGFFPQIIAGRVVIEDYPAPQGLEIVQKNLGNGIEVTTTVDANGYFLVDWANYDYRNKDQVEITIKSCAGRPECRKLVTIIDGVPIKAEEVMFNLYSTSPVYNTVKEVVYTYVCYDGQKVADVSQCPAPPAPPAPVVVQKYVCLDGSEVTDKYLCLETKEDVKQYLVVAGVGVGALSAGLVGLIVYYIRKKKRARAEKMLKTAVKNVKAKKSK